MHYLTLSREHSLTSFPLGFQILKNDNSHHNKSHSVWMNQNYAYFCQISKKYILLVCHRILVISLCVPCDEKGQKLLHWGADCQNGFMPLNGAFLIHKLDSILSLLVLTGCPLHPPSSLPTQLFTAATYSSLSLRSYILFLSLPCIYGWSPPSTGMYVWPKIKVVHCLIVSVAPPGIIGWYVLNDQLRPQALNLSWPPGSLPEGQGLQATAHPVLAFSDPPTSWPLRFCLSSILISALVWLPVRFPIPDTLSISKAVLSQ